MELTLNELKDVASRRTTFKDCSLSGGIKAWNGLIAKASNATMYHREPWLELLRKTYRFDIRIKGIEREDGELQAACVMARSKNPFARRWIALPFSDECLPLATSAESRESLVQALMASATRSEGYEIRGLEALGPWQTVNCFAIWELDLSRQLAAIERELKNNFPQQRPTGQALFA